LSVERDGKQIWKKKEETTVQNILRKGGRRVRGEKISNFPSNFNGLFQQLKYKRYDYIAVVFTA
jgi:hypothetical protein